MPDLVAEMGEAYPELAAIAERVAQVLKQEEERFGETLEHGMRILDGALAGVAKGGSWTAPRCSRCTTPTASRWI